MANIKGVARGPVVAATVAVVGTSALASHFIGTGTTPVSFQFFVLVCYGAVFLSLGAFLVRFTNQQTPAKSTSDSAATVSTTGAIHGGSAGASEGFAVRDVRGELDGDGNALRVGQAALMNSSNSSSDTLLQSSATASPLSWVSGTVGGSISWLRGSNCNNVSDGGGRPGHVAPAGRRRSSSQGGPRVSVELDAAPSAATTPGGSGNTNSNNNNSNSASSPNGFSVGFRREALPALGAGIPQGRSQQPAVVASSAATVPARLRAWSRTFGGGSGGGDDGAPAEAGHFLGMDAYDGDDSVENEDENGSAGRGDWMVGAGPGDDSESGSLSSVAYGFRGSDGGAGRRSATGESDSAGAELSWEVDNRRQMLRRSSLSGGVLTQDNQMVQDLLEMVSDAPVNHAGQWRPVRVLRSIHIWTSTVEGSPYCRIRGRMRCAATPAQLLQLLIDDERIGDYDRMFDRYELVERPNDHTSVRWTSYRAIWPTRPRDFVIRSTWEEFADGTIVIATRSVEHDDYPETPTFVRGKMVMCGYVICPLGESRRRRRSNKAAASAAVPRPTGGGGNDSAAAAAAANNAGTRISELMPSSEFTMYAHTDLGGNLPASVINKLCKKPAYRALRKIQDMIATDRLVKRAGDATEGSSTRWPHRLPSNMSRHDSEDMLGSLVAEGMPDREATSNLEDVPEGELEGASGAETETMGRQQSVATGNAAASRRSSARQRPPSTPSPLLPALSRDFAVSEAQRIMKSLNRMASDETLGWSQLSVAADSDMALYKSPIVGTKKVRLGASTCVSALSSELVGILLETAAMLGPDYIVDRQELLETFSSGVNTGEGLAEAAARDKGEAPQHDTAIYWFSCTHKRQRICRDFVILRCFRPLPGCGGLIAYSSVDHPGLPPCPDYVRGRLDVSGFVILPSPQEEDDEPVPHSDIEHNRRSGRRRKKRQRWRGGNAGGRNNKNASAMNGTLSRRRSRSSASGVGNYMDSEEDECDDEGGETGGTRGGRGVHRRGGRGRGSATMREGRVRESGVSEVTFFTHLTFSAFLPDFQEMEACRHFVGPLHILQELKSVVERTLGSSQEDEVLAEARAQLMAGGGDGADWGQVLLPRRRSSRGIGERARAEAEGQEVGSCNDGADNVDSAEVSESESPPVRDSIGTNAVLRRVPKLREAVLRDMLSFSSDGEGMDGPQVDWRIIKDGDGLKLWRASVPGTEWSMIRTRAFVSATPREVMAYLLRDECISEYDELFDKIEVIEQVDARSVFKRTCYKPIWPTTPRDFSLLCSWGTLEDGTSYVLNRSVDHPDAPVVKGYVRGVVMLCGFLMVPRLAEAGGGCSITMIVHTDLGGQLPARVLNSLSTSSPWRLVQKLRGAFECKGGRPSRAHAAAAAAAARD